jgi:hypothetical protein
MITSSIDEFVSNAATTIRFPRTELEILPRVYWSEISLGGSTMTFGRGVLLWLLGIPLPVLLLLALFWR